MDYKVANASAALKKVAKWIYWIVGIGMVIGGCYYLYNVMQRPITAVLIFLAGILALYFYYVKWFIVAEQQGAWPPYQTTCPDYLTLIPPDSTSAAIAGTSQKFKCMDTIGVSRNGVLRKSSNPPTALQKVNPEYYIEIDPSDLTDSTKRNALRALVASKGLTWTTLFGQ